MSSKLNRPIAVFLEDLKGGGAERVMLALASNLAKQGRTVDLVVVRRAGAFLDSVPASVTLHSLECSRTMLSMPPFVRYLRRRRPVAVISALAHINVVNAIGARLAGTRTTTVVTEHIEVSIDRKRMPHFPIRVAYSVIPLVYRLADHIVAVSRGCARDLARHLRVAETAVKTIYNGIDIDQVMREGCEPIGEAWETRLAGSQLIVASGRLTEQKDFSTLIRALKVLRRDGDWRLVILGEGPDREALLRQVTEMELASAVFLPGFVKNVPAFMRRANVFVLSSRWEALPTVLVEALAIGCPIVATDCPSGPAEILENGTYGTLVPVGDESAMAVAIRRAVADGCRPAENLMRARNFEASRAAANYLSLLGSSS